MMPAPLLRATRRAVAVLLLCLLSLPPFGGRLPGFGVSPAEARHGGWDQGLPHQPTDWNDPSRPGTCEGPLCNPSIGEGLFCGRSSSTRSPVYIPTGHFIWRDVDLVLPGRPAIGVIRTYNSHDARDGLFGNGWITACEEGLFKTVSNGATQYVLRMFDGKRYVYREEADGTIVPPAGRFNTVEAQADGSLHLVALDASRQIFDGSGRLTERRDPNGNALHYTYDEASGLPVRIADDYGRVADFGYHSTGRVSDVTDHAGRRWLYDYDSAGNLVSVTDPLGGVTRYDYAPYQAEGDGHVYQHLVKVTDPTGVVVTEVVYDGERVQSYTVGENRYTYTYDTVGKTVTKTDSLNSRWVYVYNDDGLIVQETDPLNRTLAYTYDANGRMTRATDALGKMWQAEYDALGRKTSESTPLGATTRFEYAGTRPEPVKVISPTGRETVLTYDARGNPTMVRDPAGFATRMEWDEKGNLLAVENALGQRTEITNDAFGRPALIRDPLARETRFGYDAADNLIRIENSLGEAVQFEYDALGRRTKAIAPSGKATVFTYDLAGRLLSVTDPAGRVTAYVYDGFGRLATRQATDGRVRTLSYRPDNLLAQVTLEDGVVVAYSYDAAKQVTQKTIGSEAFTYGYDARGYLTSAANPTGTLSLGYDDSGRRITETLNGYTLTSTWNAEDEIASVATPGYTATYTRDLRGLITRIDAGTGAYDFTYDAAGRRIGLRLPNGAAAEYVYDVANQLTRIVHSGPFTDAYDYTYDGRGLITRWQGGDFDWQYAYSADQELVQAAGSAGVFDYAYDAAGNLTGNGQVYDAANRLTEDATHTYGYDAAGNLTLKTDKATGARTVYRWNSLRQLTQVERYPDAAATVPDHVTSYAYGPLGRRWSRTVDGVAEQYVYDGVDRILTLDAAGTLTRSVTFGAAVDEPLGATGAEGSHFYHANHLGSIMALSNDQGTVVTEYDYTPYGQTTEIAPTTNPFRFTGREYEAEDLYYYRARYYDPTLGRFLSEDPIGLAGGLNLYAYVGGNPINRIDPMGEWWFLVSVFAGGGSTAAGGVAVGGAAAAGSASWGTAILGGLGFGVLLSIPGDTPQIWALPPSLQGVAVTEATTREGDVFYHYSFCRYASSSIQGISSFAGGLKRPSFATPLGNLSGTQAQQGLALSPPGNPPPDAVYTVTPTPGTIYLYHPEAQPFNGQPGGLPEVYFPFGTGPGTVSGPRPISP